MSQSQCSFIIIHIIAIFVVTDVGFFHWRNANFEVKWKLVFEKNGKYKKN